MLTGRLKRTDTGDTRVTKGLYFENAEKTMRERLERILNQDACVFAPRLVRVIRSIG